MNDCIFSNSIKEVDDLMKKMKVLSRQQSHIRLKIALCFLPRVDFESKGLWFCCCWCVFWQHCYCVASAAFFHGVLVFCFQFSLYCLWCVVYTRTTTVFFFLFLVFCYFMFRSDSSCATTTSF